MSQENQTADIKLVVFRPNGSRKEIQLRRGRYLVGRGADASLRIPLPAVSRRHCEIICDGQSVSLKDLGSSNGTFRNDERVTESGLDAGDTIVIGPCKFTLQINGEPVLSQPAPAPAEPDSPDLSETPPAGEEAYTADADQPTDLDETVTSKSTGLSSLLENTDESSMFDFDFDFEEDDNPQL